VIRARWTTVIRLMAWSLAPNSRASSGTNPNEMPWMRYWMSAFRSAGASTSERVTSLRTPPRVGGAPGLRCSGAGISSSSARPAMTAATVKASGYPPAALSGPFAPVAVTRARADMSVRTVVARIASSGG